MSPARKPDERHDDEYRGTWLSLAGALAILAIALLNKYFGLFIPS